MTIECNREAKRSRKKQTMKRLRPCLNSCMRL